MKFNNLKAAFDKAKIHSNKNKYTNDISIKLVNLGRIIVILSLAFWIISFLIMATDGSSTSEEVYFISLGILVFSFVIKLILSSRAEKIQLLDDIREKLNK